MIVGSGGEEFEDEYSDIDLCVVVGKDDDILPAFKEWPVRITELFAIIQYVESIERFLHIFLLEGFLELDIGFLSLSNLTARKGRWKVAFDYSGKIEDIMQSSWNERRHQTDIEAIYLHRIKSIWSYIMHAVVALQRNLPWKAISELGEIRNQTIELRGLREGLDTKRFRHVDKMSQEFLEDMRKTLVSSMDDKEIMNAIRIATNCFFREARRIDKILGDNFSSEIEYRMKKYLELF